MIPNFNFIFNFRPKIALNLRQQQPIGSCDEVSATCVDYDTYWRLTVIVLILFLLASLLVIGCLRDVPVVSRAARLQPGASCT